MWLLHSAITITTLLVQSLNNIMGYWVESQVRTLGCFGGAILHWVALTELKSPYSCRSMKAFPSFPFIGRKFIIANFKMYRRQLIHHKVDKIEKHWFRPILLVLVSTLSSNWESFLVLASDIADVYKIGYFALKMYVQSLHLQSIAISLIRSQIAF